MADASTQSGTDKFYSGLGQLIGAAGYLVLIIIWQGYVFSVIWSWFVVPFLALPVLSIPAAIGIRATIHFAATSTYNGPDDRKRLRKFIDSLARPLVFLGILWIVRQFV